MGKAKRNNGSKRTMGTSATKKSSKTLNTQVSNNLDKEDTHREKNKAEEAMASSDNLTLQSPSISEVSTNNNAKKTRWYTRPEYIIPILSLIVTIGIAIPPYIFKEEGTFLAMVNGQEATSPVNRTILVYLDKDSANLSQSPIDIFPQIINPSKYSLKDFKLDFKVTGDSANISYTDYYKVYNLEKEKQIEYIDNILPPKKKLHPPFKFFYIKDNEHTSIELEATYKGVKNPFKYYACVFSKKIFSENRSERLRDIFEDAYDDEWTNKKIDIYINDETYPQLYVNLSQDSIAKLFIKYINICKKGETEEAEISPLLLVDKTHNPWYLRILRNFLFIFMGIGALIVQISFMERSKRLIKFLRITTGIVIILFSCFFISIIAPDFFSFGKALFFIFSVGIAAIITILLINFIFDFVSKFFPKCPPFWIPIITAVIIAVIFIIIVEPIINLYLYILDYI